MPQAVNYWSEGAMQPIDLDEVAYYAPTYWDKMKSTIETYGKLDGENAFIFAERDPIYYNWVTLIRKDWLDQVGLDVPTTNEELIAALQAFKDAGLGVENDPLITKSFYLLLQLDSRGHQRGGSGQVSGPERCTLHLGGHQELPAGCQHQVQRRSDGPRVLPDHR